MKRFINEFGYAIFAALVIAILVTMVTPIGNYVKFFVAAVTGKSADAVSEEISNSDETQTCMEITSTSDKVTLKFISERERDETFSIYYSIREDGS